MSSDEVARACHTSECNNRSGCALNDLCPGSISDYIDRLVRPGTSNLQQLRTSRFNDDCSRDAIPHLDVNFGFSTHEDTAVEIPSGRNGGCNPDQSVIILNQCLLQSVGRYAALFNVEFGGSSLRIRRGILVAWVLMLTTGKAIHALCGAFRAPEKGRANLAS